MNPDTDGAERRTPPPNFRIFAIVGLCLLLLLFLPACRKDRGPLEPSPPDLSRCTRIEIRHYPSTSAYFLGRMQGLLNPAEMQHVQSLEVVVVDDRDRIKALARDVRRGVYQELEGAPGALPELRVTGFRDGKRLASFDVFGPSIITEEYDCFDYPRSVNLLGTVWTAGISAETGPLELRRRCAHNLQTLWGRPALREARRKPSRWCDVVAPTLESSDYRWPHHMFGPPDYTKGPFRCPSAGEGKCHYALNPSCEPDSPPDTVLLFETKAGWNQYGGPELFTFDNHEPQGGCVLLNDGTTRFIRTEEEIEQLRWK